MISFVLLWLLFFAAASSFAAFLSTFRSGKGKWGNALFILFGAVIMIFSALFSAAALYLKVKGFKPDWLFIYLFSWFLAYAGIFFFLLKRGSITAYRLHTCITSIVLFISGLFLFVLMDWQAVADLKAVQKKAQALMDSVNSQPVDAEKNALTYYEQAFNFMEKHDSLPDWAKRFRGKDDDGFSIPKAKALLEERKEAMELIKKAANTESFHNPWKASYRYEIPKYAAYRNAAYLLAQEARINAAEGDLTSSLAAIGHIFKIADHLNRQPALISDLISIAIAGIGYASLESALYDMRERKLNDLKLPAGMPLGYLENYPDVMKGERAFGTGGMAEEFSSHNIFYTMEEWSDLGFPPQHPDIPSEIISALSRFNKAVESSLYRVFFAREDIAVGERYWQGFFPHLEKPFHMGFRSFKEWEKEIKSDRGGPLTGVELLLSLDDMMGSYYAKIAKGDAMQRLAVFAIAIERFRAENRRYPSSVDELKPRFISEISLDPFDGKPLKMKAVGGGLILYSIGEDMTDDGGAEKDRDTQKGDITFLLGNIYKERRLKDKVDKNSKM